MLFWGGGIRNSQFLTNFYDYDNLILEKESNQGIEVFYNLVKAKLLNQDFKI